MSCQDDFTQALGPAVSFDPQILRSYDHDLGEMPRALMLLIDHTPRVVVAARSVADVCAALALAARHRLPVTPRGQATSGYGGAIPAKGGLVLDLSNMNRVLAVDEAAQTVDVEPGVVWEQLSKALAPHGLDNRVCPTSAPSSTVGGWFAMGGVGIGSLRFGSIRDNVLEIDVAGLDGRVSTFAGPDMEAFHQTCGALGVITRLKLACRKAEALLPVAVRLPDAARAAAFLDEAAQVLEPYSASLQSAGYCAMRARADGHEPLIDSGFLACLALSQAEAELDAARRLAERHGGRLLDQRHAEAEWAARYYPMRIKKVGPSALVGEFFVPLESFAACWRDILAALPAEGEAGLGLEAFAVRGGRLAVLLYILDDAGALLYPLRMAKAMIPLRKALRHGGAPYAAGMWFAAMAERLFGAKKFAAVLRRKAERDPDGLLNPGTLPGPGLPLLPFLDLSKLILLGTALIAPLSARLTYTRRNAG